MSDDDQRFNELSPKAAAGLLSAAEREWLDAYLREHADRRVELDWDAAFADALHDAIARMPARPGWERTAGVLSADLAASAPRTGVLDRLAQWLTQSLGWAVNVQAFAAALVVVQAGVIAALMWPSADKPQDLVRGTAQNPAPTGPLLRVSFRPDLPEARLRQALTGVGAEIVGGPGQLGVYLVRVKDGDLFAAAERLRASGEVELVEVVR
ncbi:MAG TPA: hypothetical protein VLE45_07220 [Burkholderiaceae bacterium]|nr:hypothetical protein [Burkholderiaceae bacterium]